jgi:hypothetical protein
MFPWIVGSGGVAIGKGFIVGNNLIPNGGFETAGGGGDDVFGSWSETKGSGTIAADAINYHGGAKSCLLTSGNTVYDCYIRTGSITVVPGAMYLISLFVRGDGTNDAKYGIYDVTHSAWIKSYVPFNRRTTSFVQRDILFYAPAGCNAVQLFIFADKVIGSTVNLDDVSMYKWISPSFLYDDFNRADGDPNKSPGNYPYDLMTNNIFAISNKQLIYPAGATGAAYSYIDLPKIPKIMKMRAQWANDGVDQGGSVVLAASNNRLKFQDKQHMLHFYITTVEWVFQFWDDAGAITTLGSGVLNLSTGVQYNLAMAINGNTVTLTIPTISNQIITNAAIGTYAGQYVFYEAYKNTTDEKTPIINYIEARY